MSAVPAKPAGGRLRSGQQRGSKSSVKVVVPAALSGIVASFILAISRAVGETMIVALAAGATPNLTWNPLESVQTMTAYIVQVSLGDTPQGSLEFRTIFAVAIGAVPHDAGHEHTQPVPAASIPGDVRVNAARSRASGDVSSRAGRPRSASSCCACWRPAGDRGRWRCCSSTCCGMGSGD